MPPNIEHIHATCSDSMALFMQVLLTCKTEPTETASPSPKRMRLASPKEDEAASPSPKRMRLASPKEDEASSSEPIVAGDGDRGSHYVSPPHGEALSTELDLEELPATPENESAQAFHTEDSPTAVATLTTHRFQPSEPSPPPLPKALPPLLLSRPSLEDCLRSAGIPADYAVLDKIITGREHIANIAKKLTHWKDLFPYFGLEEYEKEEIELAGLLPEQKRELLTRWTQKFGPKATYRYLCTILWEQHRVDLVEAVCEVVKSIVPQLSPAIVPVISGSSAAHVEAEMLFHTSSQQQSTLCHFSHKLRAKYAEHPFPQHLQCRKWMWMSHVGKEYIDPDIVLKEGEPHPVQLVELFKVRSGEECKIVLIEGDPGTGKSILAWQVCHRWGKGELFDQYSAVLLLPLRDKIVQQAKQMEDLLCYWRDKKDQEEVEIGSGKDTLVILDGLDELPSHLLSKQSIFTQLLSGEVLSDATVLVTSRPSATQHLLTFWKQQTSKHFVIRGFSEGNIDKYAKSILSGEKLEKINKHLSIHPHIQSIMSVPLHSAIVMAVYLQDDRLPKTLTEFYLTLVETILRQYLHDNYPEDCGKGEVSCDIIGLKLPKQIHADFIELCKAAMEMIHKNEMVLSDKIMRKELHNLGFTDLVPGQYSSSYKFPHPQIQDFLAAYHVSLSSSAQEQEELLVNSRKKDHFRNMVKFVAGITKLEKVNKEAVKQVVQVIDDEACCLDGYGLELLYESQNACILDKEDTYKVSRLGYYSPVHHYLALGSIIANSTCTWKLMFGDSHTGLEVFLQRLKDNLQPKYTISSMDVEQYSPDSVLFTERSRHFLAHIHSLSMNLFRNSEFITGLCQSLPCFCQLETLSVPNLQPDLTYMMLNALAEHELPSLKTLNMTNCSHLTFTQFKMQTYRCLFQQNQLLSKVDISRCKIDTMCVCYLVEALHDNATLKELNIHSNPINGEGAIAMANMLQHNTILIALNMSNCSIGYNGARAMADMLEKNTALQVLDIGSNSVGNRGTVAIAEVLQHNTTLTELNMDRNLVGDEGAVAMAEMLEHNTTLRELYLSDAANNALMTSKGALAIAAALMINTTLIKLNVRGNIGIGLDGIQAMRTMLDQNVTLDEQYLNKQLCTMEAFHTMLEQPEVAINMQTRHRYHVQEPPH